MKSFTSLFLILIFINGLMAQEENKDWPQLDGSSQRHGYVVTDKAPPFYESETIDVGVHISQFTYVDGVVYVSFSQTEGNSFMAYDLNSDQELWTFVVPGSVGGVNCSPTVSEDLVYVGGQRGKGLYALDRMTGDSVWFYDCDGLYGRNVTVQGDKLFFQPPSGGITCLNKSTGAVIWEYGGGSGQTIPAANENIVTFTTRLNDTLYLLDHDGQVVWKRPEVEDEFSAMVIKDDKFYLKTRSSISALELSDGTELWHHTYPDSFSFIANVNGMTWSDAGLICQEWIGDWRDTFRIQMRDFDSGTVQWSYTLEQGSSAPAVAFPGYLAHVNGGDLIIRNASDGSVAQMIENVNLNSGNRVKFVDEHLLAARGQEIVVFDPITTSITNHLNRGLSMRSVKNPVADEVEIIIDSRKDGQASLEWIKLDGSGIDQSIRMGLLEGQNRVNLRLPSTVSGIYFLRLTMNNKSITVPVVRQ